MGSFGGREALGSSGGLQVPWRCGCAQKVPVGVRDEVATLMLRRHKASEAPPQWF